jgi:hypothetical protein
LVRVTAGCGRACWLGLAVVCSGWARHTQDCVAARKVVSAFLSKTANSDPLGGPGKAEVEGDGEAVDGHR